MGAAEGGGVAGLGNVRRVESCSAGCAPLGDVSKNKDESLEVPCEELLRGRAGGLKLFPFMISTHLLT